MKIASSNKSYVEWCGLLFIFLITTTIAFAQPGNPEYNLRASTFFELDLRPVAILDIENSGSANANFNMAITAPAEAGEGFGSGALATNNDNWLNYTSAVQLGTTRNITARISAGTLPSGLSLQLTAGASGSGGGTRGTSAGVVTLTSTNQNILTGITGAYTGDGSNFGHQLSFALQAVNGNFATIATGSSTITITYTIIDN